ncbi:MAG: hypothetical protein HYV97_20105 [Bdellovibrio sp.]|nr:hypothetical protein [Bdellovibrio sp.]
MAKRIVGIIIGLLLFSACVPNQSENGGNKAKGETSLSGAAVNPSAVSSVTLASETKLLNSDIEQSTPKQKITSEELKSLGGTASLTEEELALLNSTETK